MNTFEIKEEFLLNGKPFKILSGAIHYFRIPRDYWEDSLYNLKAMGFNTVETYIPWNIHEVREGVFDFKGNRDIKAFIEKAKEMGLWVILRPSPFICAEWEFGGLPAWLLNYENIQIRTNTALFLMKVENYYRELFKQICNLQITKGGNVLMMQVENEYGSYCNEKSYLRVLASIMRKYNIDVPLFTSDGAWDAVLEAGSLIDDNILPTGNFGSRSNESLDAMEKFFKRHNKKFPLMCMEFWDGWFNRWGEDIIKRDATDLANEVKDLLKRASINLYMFHGGTNFGFYNGCSAREDRDLPQVTSYDYDAILTEWGSPTEKFYKIQQVVNELFPEIETFKPRDRKRIKYNDIELIEKVSLLNCYEKLGKCRESTYPLTMEKLGTGYGYTLYNTKVKGFNNDMNIKAIGASDRVHFFINDKHIKTQYQEEIGKDVIAHFEEGENDLKVLVENLGRVNYGYKLTAPTQQKGIRTGVMVDLHFETNWQQYALDFSSIQNIDFSKGFIENTPSFYKYKLNITENFDTFIDCSTFGKGVIFVNGMNIGRYWNKGPIQYLYLPAPFLKKGENEIIVFDTEGIYSNTLKFSNIPIYSN